MEVKEEEMELEDAEVTPEVMEAENPGLGSDSPPVVIGRKKSGSAAGGPKVVEDEGAKDAVSTPESSEDEAAAAATVVEPRAKRLRRSRWGDVAGETDRDLANLRAAQEAAEAERQARADRDQRAYALERAAITEVKPPPDPAALPEEQRRLLTPEEAAVAVLRDAINFDPVSPCLLPSF